MSQYLPTGNFKWMTDKEISKTNLGKYELESKEGLILEVDLEYPKELHDLHNDYPIKNLKRLRFQKICSQLIARRLPKSITSQLEW